MNITEAEIVKNRGYDSADGFVQAWINSTEEPDAYVPLFPVVSRYLDGKTPKQQIRLLDVGCSTGNATRWLKSHIESSGYRATVIGVDISRSRLQEAYREGNVEAPINAAFQRLPIADSSIDLLISNRLTNFFRPEQVSDCLTEAVRVLKDDGLAVVSLGSIMEDSVAKPGEYVLRKRDLESLAAMTNGFANLRADVLAPYASRFYQ